MVVRHREWYLVGHGHLRGEVRTSHLPRMADVIDTGEPFSVKGGWSLDAYLFTAVDGHQSTGPVYHVVLRFDADVAHLGEEVVWNVTQRVSRDERLWNLITAQCTLSSDGCWAGAGGLKLSEPELLRTAVLTGGRSIVGQHFSELVSP